MKHRFILENTRAPSRNNCYMFSKNGTYLKCDAKLLKQQIAWDLVSQFKKQNGKTIVKEVYACIYHYRKGKRQVDVMNLEKIICDAMTMAKIYEDDSLIKGCWQEKFLNSDQDMIIIDLSDQIPIIL